MNSDKPHDCSEVVSRVFLALDGELSHTQLEEFMEDVKRCSWCLEHYNIEKAFKEFLCSKIKKKEISSTLITEIRSKIRKISIE